MVLNNQNSKGNRKGFGGGKNMYNGDRRGKGSNRDLKEKEGLKSKVKI